MPLDAVNTFTNVQITKLFESQSWKVEDSPLPNEYAEILRKGYQQKKKYETHLTFYLQAVVAQAVKYKIT